VFIGSKGEVLGVGGVFSGLLTTVMSLGVSAFVHFEFKGLGFRV
jgi:hypothetical protein